MQDRSEPAGRTFSAFRREAFDELCAQYDPLLELTADSEDSHLSSELAAFGKLFDIDVEGASNLQIWRKVRTLLAEQQPAGQFGMRVALEEKVFLPSSESRKAEGTSREPPESLSLLVAEDDPDLSASMVEALTEAGHRVVVVSAKAEEAAVLAALHTIDLAIVDVELAGELGGVELAGVLHDRWGVPVLFISGARNEHLLSVTSSVGFIGKPFRTSELLAAVTISAGLLSRLSMRHGEP